jgi:hypothetical protein
MPKLRVTVDYMDGTTRVLGPFWPDDVDTRGMLLKLSESEIAGITFTRADPLTYLRKEGEPK